MKNVNYRKNEILRKNLYKIFNMFLNRINNKNDIIILDIVVKNSKYVKIYFSSSKSDLSELYHIHHTMFLDLIRQKLSIVIPKFYFYKRSLILKDNI